LFRHQAGSVARNLVRFTGKSEPTSAPHRKPLSVNTSRRKPTPRVGLISVRSEVQLFPGPLAFTLDNFLQRLRGLFGLGVGEVALLERVCERCPQICPHFLDRSRTQHVDGATGYSGSAGSRASAPDGRLPRYAGGGAKQI